MASLNKDKKLNIKFSLYAFVFMLLTSFVTPAGAQKLQKEYFDWSVYTYEQSGKKMCYILSFPTQKTGNYSHRGDPYVMVTHINAATDQFSTTGGYNYKPKTEPTVSIDRTTYKLSLTKDETAWPKTTFYDNLLVQKMKKANKMTVTGTSVKGTYSKDTYSLRGFTKAYQHMKRDCVH